MGRDPDVAASPVALAPDVSPGDVNARAAQDIAAMASEPDVLDLRASARDTEATARDAAASVGIASGRGVVPDNMTLSRYLTVLWLPAVRSSVRPTP